MKDIVITSRKVKKELIWFLVMFIIATGVNLYAIITYDTKLTELVTYLPLVLFISAILYLVALAIRGIVWGITKLL
jgi:hypothetical protein